MSSELANFINNLPSMVFHSRIAVYEFEPRDDDNVMKFKIEGSRFSITVTSFGDEVSFSLD